MQTVLLRTTKSLAAYWPGSADAWKQLHTDETSRRQISLVNVVMGLIGSNGILRSICLSRLSISEDSIAENQSRAIIYSFTESSQYLSNWIKTTAEMFPDRDDLLDLIPKPSNMCVSKLLKGMISTDTRNTTQLTRSRIIEHIYRICRDRGTSKNNMKILKGSCFNHLCNVWIGAIEILLSRKVAQILVEELALIPPHLHVKCDIENVCGCIDKEFNFTANYLKGHGDAFHGWMRRYHPGELMMPVIRTLGGDRQDSFFEGALPVYMGCKCFVQFLHE
jgi:hypothetical protein